jgi:hypothetical protein
MARASRALLPVVLACGLVACSATPSPSPTPIASAARTVAPTLDVGSVDPCTLLDPAQLASDSGLSVAGRTAIDTSLGTGTGCRYGIDANQSITVIVDPEPIAPGDGEAYLDSLPPDPDSEVHGFGDVAWFGHCAACPAGTTTSLTVAASPLQFTIAMTLTSPIAAQHVLADRLGRQIVDRLGL